MLSVIALLVTIRVFGGSILWESLLGQIPLFGKLIVWSNMAEFAWLMRSLLAQNLPLSRALALAADGLSSRSTAQLSGWLSKGCESGVRLSTLMESTTRVPAAMVPIVRWGEQSSSMVEAMDIVHQMLNQWLQLRSALLSAVVVPIILVLAGITICGLALSIFVPLVTFMDYFSGW